MSFRIHFTYGSLVLPLPVSHWLTHALLFVRFSHMSSSAICMPGKHMEESRCPQNKTFMIGVYPEISYDIGKTQ